jgi:hypothetical protein
LMNPQRLGLFQPKSSQVTTKANPVLHYQSP